MSVRTTKQYVEVAQTVSGDARVSRQYVEILAPSEGNARVSRQYVEILVPLTKDLEVNVEQTLTVSDSVATGFEVAEVEDTLSISDSVSTQRVISRALGDVLNLHSTGGRTAVGSGEHDLYISDTNIYEIVYYDFQYLSENLNLTQTINWDNGLYVTLSTDLNLSDSAYGLGPIRNIRNHTINMTQGIKTHWDPKCVEITDELDLSDTCIKTHVYYIQDILNLVDAAPTRVEDTFSLSQNVSWVRLVAVKDKLGISDSFTKIAIFRRSHEDQLPIADRFTYRPTLTASDMKNYTPYIGVASDGNRMDQRHTGGNRLQKTIFTVVDTGEEIILKQPRFDDQIRVSMDRVNRSLLAGELKVYRDPDWPSLETLTFTLPFVEDQVATDFLNYAQEHLGKYLYLTDWYGRMWEGIIINPESVITQNRRDSWGINVEFRGVVSEKIPFSSSLNISQTVIATIS